MVKSSKMLGYYIQYLDIYISALCRVAARWRQIPHAGQHKVGERLLKAFFTMKKAFSLLMSPFWFVSLQRDEVTHIPLSSALILGVELMVKPWQISIMDI